MATITTKDTNLAKRDILRWFQLDDQIAELTGKIKELREEKQTLTKTIENFMSENNIGDIQTQGEKLKYCKSMTKKSHTKKSLQNTLETYFNNSHNAENAYNYIMDSRETVERVRLKRQQPKIPPKNKN